MKIAYFTPVSPQKTGIADYSEKEVLPHIKDYMDIDIFIDRNVSPTNSFTLENFNVYNFNEYKKNIGTYDTAIYHMGNNGFHKFIYDSLIKYPGITVLHDIYLHMFLGHFTLLKGGGDRYIEEFKYCYGDFGAEIAKKAITGDIWVNIKEFDFKYPLVKRIADSSLGVVCHSDYGLKRVLGECDPAIVKKINQPITISNKCCNNQHSELKKIKIRLKLAKKWPIITSFGFISPHKRYDVILRSFKNFVRVYPGAVLLLVGQDSMGITRLISDLNLKESVVITGYADYNDVLDYLAISDFCVNLRYPTAGETSRSVLELMAAEKPVIVSNVGWFSEIPDNCCLKVDVDSYEEDILLEYMNLLASDEGVRNLIGKNAKEYVVTEHDPQKIARDFYIFIQKILDGGEYTLNEVSKVLADMGVKDDDTEIIRHVSTQICNLI